MRSPIDLLFDKAKFCCTCCNEPQGSDKCVCWEPTTLRCPACGWASPCCSCDPRFED